MGRSIFSEMSPDVLINEQLTGRVDDARCSCDQEFGPSAWFPHCGGGRMQLGNERGDANVALLGSPTW